MPRRPTTSRAPVPAPRVTTMAPLFLRRLLTVALAIIVCALPATAVAGEPIPEDPQPVQKLNLGGFEKSLPMAIGGGITVGVLMLGFFFLNAKKPQPVASPDWQSGNEPLPPHVVGGTNPLRYLVAPILFLTLLAAAVPLGFSILKGMPGAKALWTPPTSQFVAPGMPIAVGTPLAPIDINDFKRMPIPSPIVNTLPPLPPPIRLPPGALPPIRVQVPHR
jgi:hypothetical protein